MSSSSKLRLHFLAFHGEASELTALLNDGRTSLWPLSDPTVCDVNATDEAGRTALWWAAVNNKLNAVTALLSAGANPAIAGKSVHFGRITPAEVAQRYGHKDVYTHITSSTPVQNDGATPDNGRRETKERVDGPVQPTSAPAASLPVARSPSQSTPNAAAPAPALASAPMNDAVVAAVRDQATLSRAEREKLVDFVVDAVPGMGRTDARALLVTYGWELDPALDAALGTFGGATEASDDENEDSVDTVADLLRTADVYTPPPPIYPADRPFPPHWSMNDPNEFLTRIVDVTSEMRTKVQALIDATCDADLLNKGRDTKVVAARKYTQLAVKKIERIENPRRWKHYTTTMQDLAMYRHLPVNDVATFAGLGVMESRVNEHYFFHCTKPEYIEQIIDKGLDNRLAAMSGLLGAGIYLAENSSKADQYAVASDGDMFHMFLVRACLGTPMRTITSHRNMRVPDVIKGCEPRRFDSVLAECKRTHKDAHLNLYREFSLYLNTQCYVEYHVMYARE